MMNSTSGGGAGEEFAAMGCLSGSKERGMNADDDFSGPVQSRQCTDVFFLILKIVFVIGLFGLVGYCMVNGDLHRLFNGYDNCGNVCGRNNPKSSVPGFDCKGGDFTAKKYLKYDGDPKKVFDVKHSKRECVANCTAPGYVQFLTKCFKFPNETTTKNSSRSSFEGGRSGSLGEPRKKNLTVIKPPKKKEIVQVNLGDFFEEVAEDMGNVWPQMIYLCLIAFGLSLFFLLMFRYAAPVMVWATLGLCIVLTTGLAIFCWVMYSKIDTNTKKGQMRSEQFRDGGIMMTIIAVVVILIILVMRRRIRLVIQLFEEAARAAAAMPLLFIQPIYTFLSLAIILILWFYFALWIQSSGKLAHVDDDSGFYYYKKDMAMKVARWYNIFAVFWMSQFVISCQHMVLAGAVATWYFTRNKSDIGAPIWRSFVNLVRYHLGTVLLASLVMAIIAFIKFLLRMIERTIKDSDNSYVKFAYICFKCVMNCVERIFNMISRNAYVEVAIYGKGFCPSARRALKLLWNNAFNVLAVNSVGDFVLLMNKLLIVIITVSASTYLIGGKDHIHHPWIPMLLIALFTFFIAHTFVSILEMIIDTVFVCFCEDCEMNDGINKPFYMNRGLMEFVENSKRVLKIKDKEKTDEQQGDQPPPPGFK